jgi:hypothetical protein
VQDQFEHCISQKFTIFTFLYLLKFIPLLLHRCDLCAKPFLFHVPDYYTHRWRIVLGAVASSPEILGGSVPRVLLPNSVPDFLDLALVNDPMN